ncbi:MAG: hypothetical protein NVS1B11_31980 [Terriglobales bacterium]
MKTRRELSRKEQESHLVHARALADAGVTIKLNQNHPAQAQLLKVDAPRGDSFLFAQCNGGMGIAVWLRIVALRSDVQICGWGIDVPWGENGFYLQICAEHASFYTAAHGPEYSKVQVLNHRLQRRLNFREILEGVLLLRTSEKLSDFYGNGTAVPVSFSFFDQLDNRYSVAVSLPVILDQGPKRRSQSTGLFAGRGSEIQNRSAQQSVVVATKSGTNDDKS